MRPRPAPGAFCFLCVLAVALVLLEARAARALTCSGPPPVVVLYPEEGIAVPRDAVLLLVVQGSPELKLVERESGREVWTRPAREKGSPLVRLIPSRLLKAETAHELRGRFGAQAREHVVLRTFQTGGGVHRGGRSAWRNATLAFSPPIRPAEAGMRLRPGRSATLTLGADPEPVAVEARVVFRVGGRPKVRFTAAHAYATELTLASTRACDVFSPAAPERGTYEVKLVPYGETGEAGPVLTLRGVIR